MWAVEGLGVHGPVQPRPAGPDTVLVSTRSHSTPELQQLIERWLRDGLISSNERMGGSGAKVVRLLENSAQVYVHLGPGTKKWDSCAPEAVLREAGGLLTDVDGRPLHYDSAPGHVPNLNGLLGTVPHLDQQLYVSRL